MFYKCVPILMYGLEAICLNNSQLSNLSFVYNAFFVKLFSSFDKAIIANCQYYCGCLPFVYSVDKNKINFFQSLHNNLISPASLLFKWFGHLEYDTWLSKYGLIGDDSKQKCVEQIWLKFQTSMPVVN